MYGSRLLTCGMVTTTNSSFYGDKKRLSICVCERARALKQPLAYLFSYRKIGDQKMRLFIY